MKKYYIADLLTVLEVLLTGVIVWLGLMPEISTGVASFVILIAELCDAFDGIAARKWSYPDEPGKYPWRKFATLYDILSDLLLGAVALGYIIIRALPKLPSIMVWVFLGLLVVGILVAIIVEIIALVMTRQGNKKQADRIAVWRRRVIYIPAVVVVILWPLFASGWAAFAIAEILIQDIIIGLLIFCLKQNRWNERVTK